MALNIKNADAQRIARELAQAEGSTITKAVTKALREALNKVNARNKAAHEVIAEELDAIALHCASLPVIDSRPAEEILGYDENGSPRSW